MDPSVLANALREEAAAKADLGAQQAKMQRVQEKADAPIGGPTFLDAIAGYTRRDRMNEKAESMEPMLKKARERAAATYGSGDIYNARVAQDERQYGRQQDSLKAARQRRIDKQAREQRELENQRAAAETAEDRRRFGIEQNQYESGGVNYVNRNDPNDVIAAFRTPSGMVDAEGNPIGREYKVDETQGTGSSGRSRAKAEGEALDYYNLKSGVNNAFQIAENFTPAELAQLEDLQPRLTRLLAEAVTPQKFTELMKGELSSVTPRMKDFFAVVNSGGARLRNELFGSALTTNEERNSNQFIASAPGLRLSAIQRRLLQVDTEAEDGLNNLDRAYSENFSERDEGAYKATDAYRAAQAQSKRQGDTEKTSKDKGAVAAAQSLIDSGSYSGEKLEDLKAIKANPDAEGAQELLQFYMDGG